MYSKREVIDRILAQVRESGLSVKVTSSDGNREDLLVRIEPIYSVCSAGGREDVYTSYMREMIPCGELQGLSEQFIHSTLSPDKVIEIEHILTTWLKKLTQVEYLEERTLTYFNFQKRNVSKEG